MEPVKEQSKLTDNLTQDNFHSFLSRFVPALQYLYEESSLSNSTKQITEVPQSFSGEKESISKKLPFNFRKEGVWLIQPAVFS